MQAAIDAFWKWFAAHPGRWEKPGDDFDEQKLLEIYDHVGDSFPQLSPQIEWLPGGGYELIFSLVMNRDAAQRREATPLVRALVASAPRSKVWKFSAFAKPVGWNDAYLPQLDFPEDSKLVVDRMRYERLSEDPLALRVYVPHYSKKHHDHFVIAVERVLEAGMGEAWVLEKLRRLELADAKKAPKGAKRMQTLSR